MKLYKKVAVLPEGVWSQTVASLGADPKRWHPADKFSDKKPPEEIRMFSYFDWRQEALEKMIGDRSAYAPPAHFDWGSLGIAVRAYSPRHCQLSVEELGICDQIGLGDFGRAVFKTVKDADLIILGPRSNEFTMYTRALRDIFDSAPMAKQSPDLVSLTKGLFLEYDKQGKVSGVKLPYEIMEDHIPQRISRAIMVGPNISKEVNKYAPTTSLLATKQHRLGGRRDEFLQDLRRYLKGFNFGVDFSVHPHALGWATAVKNITAIAMGLGNYYLFKQMGDEYTDYNSNLLGCVVTMGSRDSWNTFTQLINRHGLWFRLHPEEYHNSFAVQGDRVATASSLNSRNVRFGFEFAKQLDMRGGEVSPEDKDEIRDHVMNDVIKMAVEGVPTVKDLHEVMEAYSIKGTPFYRGVYETLFGSLSTEKFAGMLLDLTGRYESIGTRTFTRFLKKP